MAYLSLRNFNLTDENLVQSSPTYIQRQRGSDSAAASSNRVEDNPKYRLALMLESFLYHLRKDHLRRIQLDELELLALNMNLSLPEFLTDDIPDANRTMNEVVVRQVARKPLDRCHYLVELYRIELENREKAQQPATSTEPASNVTTNNRTTPNQASLMTSRIPDPKRLFHLCRLVVDCQSADDFLNLITGPWRETSLSSRSSFSDAQPLTQTSRNRRSMEQFSHHAIPTYESGTIETREHKATNLRESLSISLAKLCPLILFQLHDSEGPCTAHRDDRPPMTTVWAFATLFVTIVSFCSLIGLSITPLLGTSGTHPDSSGMSDLTDSSSTDLSMRPQRTTQLIHNHESQPSRACLTLFEGLAVGSLVGSALFSLIPQAFELQERESNQGFLLKALIIFFGIYLFFCSERIMRIILDTRQQRKRARRLGRLGSTSLHFHPSTTIDGYDGHHAPLSVQFAPASSSSFGHQARDRLNWRCPASNMEAPQRIGLAPFTRRERPDGVDGLKSHKIQVEKVKPVTEKSRSKRFEVANDDIRPYLKDQRPHNSAKTATRRRRRRAHIHSRSKRYRLTPLKSRHGMGHSMKKLSHDDLNHEDTDSSSSSKHVEAFKNQARYSDESAKEYWNSKSESEADSDWTDDEQKAEIRGNRQDHSSIGFTYENRRGDHMPESACSHRQTSFSQTSSKTGLGSSTRQFNQAPSPMSMMDGRYPAPVAVERDISTVAWMIVLGDGLHNFIDGISIGAAFSESILSGVSISVAVICEEFPHELGDFAVLVSSGMTVRQALGYNFLSACTCYIGMAFGIILGDVNEGASYISSLAAGVFLYIALVDMMGELSATLEKSSRGSLAKTLNLLFLQNVGIFIGISIIFALSFIDF